MQDSGFGGFFSFFLSSFDLKKGGIWMWPIVVVMALGIAVAIERYVYLTVSRTKNRFMLSKVLGVLQRGDFQQAFTVAAKSSTAIGRMLAQGLSRYKASQDRGEIESAMEESMLEVIPRLEKRTHYIPMFANVATLLGLLGTITGLIAAFQSLGTVDAAQKAAKLSEGISTAMATTAFGLIVAIPLLMIHAVIQSKTTEIVDSLEMATVKFVNLIVQRKSGSSSKESKES